MRATIRLNETLNINVEGEGLPEIQAKLEAARPDGFDLVNAPVKMNAGSTTLTAVGTFSRRDQTREIEGATMADLRAATPDGWQMLYIVK